MTSGRTIRKQSKALELKRNAQCAAYFVPDGDIVGIVRIREDKYDSTAINTIVNVDDAI
jgi:hypothetical protein